MNLLGNILAVLVIIVIVAAATDPKGVCLTSDGKTKCLSIKVNFKGASNDQDSDR